MSEESKYICEKCGEVKPIMLWYTHPLTARCPKCGIDVVDSNCKFNILSKEEAMKKRPSFNWKFWENNKS
jgi:late competence protein required for DNA uptake (superfamily II DNA/RNA helicase)